MEYISSPFGCRSDFGCWGVDRDSVGLALGMLDAVERYERDAEAHASSGREDTAAELLESALRLRIQSLGAGHSSLPAAAEAKFMSSTRMHVSKFLFSGMQVWESGNLETGDPGNLEIWDPQKNETNKNS